jgi:DHA2 family multidrug resistance protein
VVLGRLASRIDLRWLLLAGLLILSASLYWMSGFSLDAPAAPFVWSGLVLGFGGACAVLALNVAPYASLPLDLRAEATTFLSLVRGVAQSTGVSLTTTLLTQNTQIVHADLASHLTVTRDWSHTPFFGQFFFDHGRLAVALDGLVNRQASMVAYINDFYFLFWLSLAVLPMILLIGSPRRQAARGAAAAMVE